MYAQKGACIVGGVVAVHGPDLDLALDLGWTPVGLPECVFVSWLLQAADSDSAI